MDLIQLNRFSDLHDEKNVFFCKTDFIIETFNQIKSLDNEVVLITGNSDYGITNSHIYIMPKNIKKWYAQNAMSNHPVIDPLPFGIENKFPSSRLNHGVGYFDRVTEKEQLLNRKIDIVPNKFIYSNFDVLTNSNIRTPYMNLSKQLSHIDWEESNLPLEKFFDRILEYKMILCPQGNGVDTHRLWEALYLNRVPIIVKSNNHKIYDLYKKLPIIILDNINQLRDYKYIEYQYDIVKNKKNNLELLEFSYWVNKIKTEL
jgi:hypothetical protein